LSILKCKKLRRSYQDKFGKSVVAQGSNADITLAQVEKFFPTSTPSHEFQVDDFDVDEAALVNANEEVRKSTFDFDHEELKTEEEMEAAHHPHHPHHSVNVDVRVH